MRAFDTHRTGIWPRVPLPLWTLFAVLLAGLSLVASVCLPLEQEKRTINRLRRTGDAQVELHPWCCQPFGRSPLVDKLQELTGWDWFPPAYHVTLFSGFPTTRLKELKPIRDLFRLTVGATFGDDDLREVAKLPRIPDLSLGESRVSDAGLALLAERDLFSLRLDDTSIGDDGVRSLGLSSGLYELCLNGTRITDRGMETLSGLPELDVLHLDRTAVTDAGLSRLRPGQAASRLSLRRTAVTEAGLRGMPVRPEVLNISHSAVRFTPGFVAWLESQADHMCVFAAGCGLDAATLARFERPGVPSVLDQDCPW